MAAIGGIQGSTYKKNQCLSKWMVSIHSEWEFIRSNLVDIPNIYQIAGLQMKFCFSDIPWGEFWGRFDIKTENYVIHLYIETNLLLLSFLYNTHLLDSRWFRNAVLRY